MTLFSISCLLVFFASVGFGLFVYNSNPQAKLNRIWFGTSAIIGLWGLTLYGVTTSPSAAQALLWQYPLDVMGILIPAFYFYFVTTFVGVKNLLPARLAFLGAALLSFISFSAFFKTGMSLKFGFFWVDPGPLYFVFPLFFVGLSGIASYLLFRFYLVNKDTRIARGQALSLLFAGLIGFGGGATNFFPQLFDLYPFGNYLIIVYVFFYSYSVLKFKFFNTKIISVQIFAGALVLLFIFNVLSTVDLQELLIRIFMLVAVSVVSVFLVRGVYKEVESREQIEKLALDLEQANEKLKEFDRLKSEFLSMGTHQLRSPLTAIKGYASLILDGSFGKPPKAIEEAVDRIYQSSRSMANTIEDFLTISRIEQNRMKYDFAVTDMGKLVKDVMAELLPNAIKAGLQLTYVDDKKSPYNANIDLGKIRQVIINFLDNAMKYTPKGSITVRVGRNDTTKKILVSFVDTGVGMSQETIGKLFQRFSRAEDANKVNVMGTGLGLFVAKEMVAAHKGGRVWAESEGPGKGSQFYVELDAAN